jgi:catechol 2,3-dioxygenase-like lactoylglutathione lyase family enzyme
MCDLGVHSLDHFAMAVPDLDEAARFYGAFGLGVAREADGLALRTAGDPHVWVRLSQGPRKRLERLVFGIFAADAAAFAARLPQAADGFATTTPDGVPIRIIVAPKTTLDSKLPFALAPAPDSAIRGTQSRVGMSAVHPRRLAHISLFVRDVPQSIEFFEAQLGLRLSDRSGNDVAFMHAQHGSDHHLIALARSTGPGLHHCSWDVATLDEVGRGAMRMAQAGYAQGWGLGRHVLGSNYFHYVRDPWGSYCEYSADMDHIPAGLAWESGDHPGEDSFYQWGPPPPDDFVTNYELAN